MRSDLDLSVYTIQKPEFHGFLRTRYHLEEADPAFHFRGCSTKRDRNRHGFNIPNPEGESPVEVTVDQEPRHDFYPRYIWELKIKDLRGLPIDLLRRGYSRDGGFLVGDEELLSRLPINLQGYKDNPLRRFLEVLRWSGGRPIYHTHFAASYGDQRGITDAAGLSRILAERFDGIVWNPLTAEFGSPDVEPMLENCTEPGSLWKAVTGKPLPEICDY